MKKLYFIFLFYTLPVITYADFISLIKADQCETIIEVFVQVNAKEDGIAYQVNWIVKGDVGHWGHIHRRTNQYDAIVDVRPIDGVWKFSNIEIVEEKRL